MKLKLLHPTDNPYFIQRFGLNGEYYQKNGINIIGHNGIDFRARHGETIYAAHDGYATLTGEDGAGGIGVVIRTNEPMEYLGGTAYIKSIYWHMVKGGILVRAGDKIVAGQPIGLADSTGFSTGDHLHFGIKPQAQGENDYTWENVEQKNGYNGAIDPEPYLVPTFHVNLSYKENNFRVLELQRFLGVSKTGYYGEETRKAVLRFQIEKVKLSWYERYTIMGKQVGPKTREALNKKSLQG